MKKVKKIIYVIVILMFTLYGVLGITNNSYCKENTTNSNNTINDTSKSSLNSNSNLKKESNANETQTKEKEKSNNANLSDLGIKPNDFSGFKYNKTTYDVEVPESTDEVEIYAKVQDSKAKVEGTGNIKLEKRIKCIKCNSYCRRWN